MEPTINGGRRDVSRPSTSKANGKKDHKHMVIEVGNVNDHQKQVINLVGAGGRGSDHHRDYNYSLPYVNCLSSWEMDSLTALCDTFLPSIDVSDVTTDDSVVKFYATCASMTGTPEHLGGLISSRLEHPRKWMIRVSLFLLSTWIGSLILCGRGSISRQYPYFQRFSQISSQKREEIVLSWSLSCFYTLRMLFRTMKLLILFVFFTQVNEKNENISWKAIRYAGPDPQFKSQTQLSKTSKQTGYGEHEKEDQDGGVEDFYGPLYRGIINLKNPRDMNVDTLRRFGFPTSVVCGKNNISSLSCPYLVIKCDAVVIGSGSGGGVVAGVLSKAGYKVLVLEKGSYCARKNLSLLEGPTLDEMYLSGGLVATIDMGTLILAGSTVGGGSAINWSASIRTPQHVINDWCDSHELELFDSELYKKAMDVVCEKMGVQSEFHDEGFSNMILRRGCQELGYPVNTIPRNSQADHYCGWCSLGCKDGKKKGTSETWLVDLVSSGNGAILPGCEAIKVLNSRNKGRDRKTATGVAFEFEHKGAKEICVVESKVTIVACGALCTPELLRKSGLKNENIGKNLHLHPVAMAWGYFPDAPLSNVWPKAEKKCYEGGIMTAMSTVTANFDGSGYGAMIQTPSLHPGTFSMLVPWVSSTDMRSRMCKFSRTAHIFALARDKGSGTVFSPNSISYQMEESDEENLKNGLEKVLRILAAAGAEEIGTHNCKGKTLNVKKASSREFEKFVKEESSRRFKGLSTPLCSAHQMGSCRMGVDPKKSVVNQMGETWEVEGLFVADTSVFPTALGVNPMVTVQTIAYCTAQSALEALRRKKCR